MRRGNNGGGLGGLGFGCLAATILAGVAAAALWVIFAWGVNQA
jgi:hypothetical protein